MATLTVLNVTQISLTAGDWDVHGFAGFAPNAATTVQFLAASISTVSATLNNTPGSAEFQPCYGNTPGAFASPVSVSTGPVRLSLNATTTVYLVAQAQFGVNVMSVSGLLRARRVR
jgi:hypothetical protein